MIKWLAKPSGFCPVQASGYFLGYYFYFRARWNEATLDFANTEQDWWDNKLLAEYTAWRTSTPQGASWLNHKFCRVLIWMGCVRFLFKIK